MIYLFLAPGFEEIEALTTVDILRRAECELKTVGVGGKRVTGAHGIEVTADLTQEEAVTEGLEMVILPGGVPGTPNLEKSPVVRTMVDYCHEKGLWLAAICAAPSIFGHWGLLAGKRATCFPGYEDQLSGAAATGESVVVDGKIITGKGAGVTIPFALKIVEQLVGKDTAEKLRKSMQCQ